jgi:HEAT repeat protein
LTTLDELLQDLASDEPEDRLFAVLELGEVEDIRALEALATPLDDPDPEVRLTTAETIAERL